MNMIIQFNIIFIATVTMEKKAQVNASFDERGVELEITNQTRF